jgi:hypothetical protein
MARGRRERRPGSCASKRAECTWLQGALGAAGRLPSFGPGVLTAHGSPVPVTRRQRACTGFTPERTAEARHRPPVADRAFFSGITRGQLGQAPLRAGARPGTLSAWAPCAFALPRTPCAPFSHPHGLAPGAIPAKTRVTERHFGCRSAEGFVPQCRHLLRRFPHPVGCPYGILEKSSQWRE